MSKPITHLSPDNHLTLCGKCTCDRPKLKFAPEGQATCKGCNADAKKFQEFVDRARKEKWSKGRLMKELEKHPLVKRFSEDEEREDS